jgi:hypothetical protein
VPDADEDDRMVREAKAGRFPAQRAVDGLRERWALLRMAQKDARSFRPELGDPSCRNPVGVMGQPRTRKDRLPARATLSVAHGGRAADIMLARA